MDVTIIYYMYTSKSLIDIRDSSSVFKDLLRKSLDSSDTFILGLNYRVDRCMTSTSYFSEGAYHGTSPNKSS